MTKIDTSAAAVERVAARGDVYVFEDAKGATNIGAFIRALAAERDALAARLAEVECALATARAETGALIERAAALCEAMASQVADAVFCGLPEQARIREGMEATYTKAAILIRALSPDATAALTSARRAAKAEGMREAAKVPGFYFGIGPDGEPDGTYCSVKPHNDPQAELYVRASRILARADQIEKGATE